MQVNLIQAVCQIVRYHAACLLGGIQTGNRPLDIAGQFTARAVEQYVVSIRCGSQPGTFTQLCRLLNGQGIIVVVSAAAAFNLL
ncbi:hypothetical protein D3C76_1411080 [compost metagenome]